MTETRRSSSVDRSRPSAFDFALARLAQRAHSEKELSVKLARAKYSATEIELALESLRSRRYLDDRAYAASFAERAVELKLWGPDRIRRALAERGLPGEYVESALMRAFPEGEKPVIARALSRFSRRQRSEHLESRDRRQRAYRYLFARGYSPEAIRAALKGT